MTFVDFIVLFAKSVCITLMILSVLSIFVKPADGKDNDRKNNNRKDDDNANNSHSTIFPGGII